MPYVFSEVATRALDEVDRCITDLRNAPIRGRNTRFRLAQQNMVAYTFADFVPGFSASVVHNTTPYSEIIEQPLINADLEGRLFFDVDYVTAGNARAKVAGDIFEVVSAAVMWNIAARWNVYMMDGAWPTRTAYPRPDAKPSENRMVAVLNLPRDFDWVRLLTPEATDIINGLRHELGKSALRLPTSTPDLAVVILPETRRYDGLWRTGFPNFHGRIKPSFSTLTAILKGRLNRVRYCWRWRSKRVCEVTGFISRCMRRISCSCCLRVSLMRRVWSLRYTPLSIWAPTLLTHTGLRRCIRCWCLSGLSTGRSGNCTCRIMRRV